MNIKTFDEYTKENTNGFHFYSDDSEAEYHSMSDIDNFTFFNMAEKGNNNIRFYKFAGNKVKLLKGNWDGYFILGKG